MQKYSSGAISTIRRNIMLMRFMPYEHEQVQEEIFEKVFVSLEDQPRMTIDELIEKVRKFFIDGKVLDEI